MASVSTSELRKALRGDDAAELVRLLDEAALTKIQKKRAVNFLVESIERGKPAVFRALLDWDAEINEQSSSGYCPLVRAAYYNRVEFAAQLLQMGAELERMDKFNWVALQCAQSVEMAQLLLDAGADIECDVSRNGTALYWACLNYRGEVAALLLSRGAQVDPPRCSPLYAAVDRGQPDMVKVLLDAGAQIRRDIEHPYTNLGDALIQARQMRQPNSEIIEMLEASSAKAKI